MSSSILPVILPIVICAALGFAWRRAGQAFPSDFVGRLVLWVGAPSLIVGTLGSVPINIEAFQRMFGATALMLGITAVLVLIACRLLRLPIREYATPLLFGNSGNMGLPLCLFAYGEEGLALSLCVFVLTSFIHFSAGVSLLSGRLAARPLLGSPIVWSGLVALLLLYSGAQLPETATNTLTILGGMAIPLMLLTLGVSLGELQWRDGSAALGLGALRLLLGLSGGLLTVWLLELDGLVRGVILLQAATPSA